MRCPKCGSTDCQVFVTNSVKMHSSTQGFGAGKACCGSMCLGPIGLLCGAVGAGKSKTWSEQEQQDFWICQKCGSRFTARDVESAPIPVQFYLDNVNEFAEYEHSSIVQKFIQNYSEDWSISVLGNDMIVRQSSDKKFLKHKDSCEGEWFEGTPALFAIEDCTGVIVTGKDIIIDTVRVAFNEILNVAIQADTVYIGKYCARFSSIDKAKKFLEILKIILDSNKVRFEEYDSYEGLLACIQGVQNDGNTSKEAHFSSQPEYENFVKCLTEKGLKKVEQERPQHYRNYMQAEQDEKMLRQPAVIAYVIQMVLIFLIRIIFAGFWSAIFNTVLWGAILGVILFFYDSKIEERYEKEKEKYLPPELIALITENKLSALQKSGNIKIAELERYEQLYGIEQLQKIDDRESIKQKQIYLYGILAIVLVCITAFHILLVCDVMGGDKSTKESKNVEVNGQDTGASIPASEEVESNESDIESEYESMTTYEEIEEVYEEVVDEELYNSEGQEPSSVLLNERYISNVSASSELSDSTHTYGVDALFDDKRDTCWAEGVDGNGEGEYVEIQLISPTYLTDIYFLNGYMKNEDVYNKNGKIRRVELSFSDGTSYNVDFEDCTYQEVENQSYSNYLRLENPIYTDYIKITILEAEAGEKYDDICLSELELWGYSEVQGAMDDSISVWELSGYYGGITDGQSVMDISMYTEDTENGSIGYADIYVEGGEYSYQAELYEASTNLYRVAAYTDEEVALSAYRDGADIIVQLYVDGECITEYLLMGQFQS